MDITPYVERLRNDLQTAADGAGDQVADAARLLAFALDPAARLALMEALSQASAEITAEMPRGSVEVRLDGRDLAFVVDVGTDGGHAPVPPTPPAPPAASAAPRSGEGEETDGAEDDAVARFTLRLPDSLKSRAEDTAAQAGVSLNTWLVALVRRATSGDAAISVDVDLSSLPLFGNRSGSRSVNRQGNGPRRVTGWM